jgi:hypothetical protein
MQVEVVVVKDGKEMPPSEEDIQKAVTRYYQYLIQASLDNKYGEGRVKITL